MKKPVLSSALIMLSLLVVNATEPDATRFASWPKGFIENKGQVKDQKGILNRDVKFLFSSGNFNLELKEHGFSYEFFRGSKVIAGHLESGDAGPDDTNLTITAARVDVTLQNANTGLKIAGQKESGFYYNYFGNALAQTQTTFIKCFDEVLYGNVYPGIDLIFKIGEEGKLKYEFIVHPGADPRMIQLKYSGAHNLSKDRDGNLNVTTSLGVAKETGLHCFLLETKEPVNSQWSIRKNIVTFDVPVIKNQTLVIDPNIVWGTYFGGETLEEIICEIAVDKGDRTVITGSTLSLSSIATTGSYQSSFAGFEDAFVAKFKTNGKLNWATYYGGESKDLATGIDVDNQNNIFITGITRSFHNIATPAAYQATYKGSNDGFVAKFDASGIILWSTYIGGMLEEDIKNLTCDPGGTVYITGQTFSVDLSTPGAFQQVNTGKGDILLAKFSASGALLWLTYLGGDKSDRGQGLTTDLQGNVIVVGTVESKSNIASPDAYQPQYGGGTSDAMVAKFDSAGTLIWSTYYGGKSGDHGRTPVTDSSGDIYFVGFTTSTHHIATAGSHQEHWFPGYGPMGEGKFDAMIVKLTADGHRVWGSYYGGEDNDEFYGVAIGTGNKIYLGGTTKSEDSIATPNAFKTEKSEFFKDGLLVEMDSSGKRIWGSYFGGGGDESIQDVASNKGDFIYFVMNTDSVVPVSPGALQTENNGAFDLAVYKFFAGNNCYDYNEPNESLATAKLIVSSNDTGSYGYNGSVSSSADGDWFSFKIKNNETNIKIQLTDLTVNYDLQLYDNLGMLIQQSSQMGTEDENIVLNGATKKKYYIFIPHDATAFDTVNCYRLIVLTSTTPFKVTRDTQDESMNLEVKVSPVPASRHLHLSIISDSGGEAEVNLYNQIFLRVADQQVLQVAPGNTSHEMELPFLPDGLYILEVKKNQDLIRKKIIIIH